MTSRNIQADVLLHFIETLDEFFWFKRPAILGGDFNTLVFQPGGSDKTYVYERLTENFADSFASFNLFNH